MWGGAFPHRVPDAPRPVSEPDAQAPARSEQQRSPTHDRVQGHLRSRDTGPGFPWLPTEAGGFQRAVWLRVVDWRRADATLCGPTAGCVPAPGTGVGSRRGRVSPGRPSLAAAGSPVAGSRLPRLAPGGDAGREHPSGLPVSRRRTEDSRDRALQPAGQPSGRRVTPVGATVPPDDPFCGAGPRQDELRDLSRAAAFWGGWRWGRDELERLRRRPCTRRSRPCGVPAPRAPRVVTGPGARPGPRGGACGDAAARMARPPQGPTRPARSAIGTSPGGPALCPSRPPRHAVPSVSNAFPRCAPARPRLPSGHRLHVTGADGRPLAGSPPAPRGRTCPATRPAAPRYAPILSKTPVCGPGPRA